MNIEERLTELEIQIAHQENTIEELGKVILAQQDEITIFANRIVQLESIAKGLSPSNVRPGSEDSPPPHY